MKFTSKVYVRWADLDAFGHVNNAVYLTYAELARVVFAKMKTVQVMIDLAKMKSRPISEAERAFLNKYLVS